MTSEYDDIFKHYADIYFPNMVRWPWFKAQGMAESNLRLDAVSEAGARGIMQIMPATGAEIARHFQIVPSLFDPRCNIQFGIFYMRRMWDIFKHEEGLERLRFAFGGYNAGAGNIIKAQAKTDRPDNWEAVRSQLHQITGAANAQQTTDYVRRIEKYRLQIIEA